MIHHDSYYYLKIEIHDLFVISEMIMRGYKINNLLNIIYEYILICIVIFIL
jgi:hypothetical protein